MFKPDSIRRILIGLVAIMLLITGHAQANSQAFSRPKPKSPAPLLSTGIIYSQPADPNGGLIPSSRWDPTGSDSDQYVWDDFTLASTQSITDIQWVGGYDPTVLFGAGAAFDFSVQIYPSISTGTQPDVTNPPLVSYLVGGNAGQTLIGAVNGINMYSYAFTLPTAFTAGGGTKYWVQIEALENGTPDWGIALGTGGDGKHFKRTISLVGDPVHYQVGTGDAAFSLLGPVADTPTPTNTPTDTPVVIPTDTPTDTPTNTAIVLPTDTPTNTPTDTPTPTATNTATQPSPPPPTPTFTATNTPTVSPTNTSTDTPTPTATNTATQPSPPPPTPTFTATNTPTVSPTNTLTDTPTPTPTDTATQPSPPPPTPTFTATNTPTASPTNTPTDTPTPTYTPTFVATPTPTSTPLPSSNTPGRVTGGGSFGLGNARGTFGFTVSFSEGAAAPRGSLTYQDHASNLRFKATSFDSLVIDGNHASFEGMGKVNGGPTIRFRVEVNMLRRFGETDTFFIYLPALSNYAAGGELTGGRITIHLR